MANPAIPVGGVALDALTAIDPATLSAGDRDDREMLISGELYLGARRTR